MITSLRRSKALSSDEVMTQHDDKFDIAWKLAFS